MFKKNIIFQVSTVFSGPLTLLTPLMPTQVSTVLNVHIVHAVFSPHNVCALQNIDFIHMYIRNNYMYTLCPITITITDKEGQVGNVAHIG